MKGGPVRRSRRRCWPNGVRLMARSFKYHRPRGVVTVGSEEPNALVMAGRGIRRTYGGTNGG